MSKRKHILPFGVLTVLALIYILVFPYEAAYYTKNALSMCALSIIPSLFLFMVFTRILSHLCSLGFMSGGLSKLFSRVFNLPVCLIPICLTGLFCGAPSGAFSICKLYSDGFCTKDEAERACILTGNCSAAFIMGVVSATAGGRYASVYILISSLTSVITVYLLLFRGKGKISERKEASKNIMGFFEAITESISSSAGAVIALSAYVVFFYTAGGIFSARLANFLKSFGVSSDFISTARVLISSIFEIGLGINSAGLISGTEATILSGAAVSFTGISLILQVTGIMKRHGLSIKDYILTKILCAFLCPVYLTLILLTAPADISVFSDNAKNQTVGVTVGDVTVLIFITAVVFAAARLLSYLDKKYKK